MGRAKKVVRLNRASALRAILASLTRDASQLIVLSRIAPVIIAMEHYLLFWRQSDC
jgi:hypothetical protein